MKHKKLPVLVLVLVFVASLFTGCGAASDNFAPMDAPAADAPAAMAPEIDYGSTIENDLSSVTDAGQMTVPENQKIITTLDLSAQTEDMDAILGKINGKVAELGGYIEAQEIYNGSAYASYRYRHAYLTIRIPADHLGSFVSHVSENANIVSENTTTENITLTYVATESRITALETERDRLLELLAMAENMEDLLLIESRLTEVVAELENVTSQLRLYDNLVSYSTVHLDIEEVKEYTDIQEEPETVWERISSGFGKSLKNLGKGLTNVFVFIVVKLPYLVLIGAVVAAVLIVISRTRKGKGKKVPDGKKPPEEKPE